MKTNHSPERTKVFKKQRNIFWIGVVLIGSLLMLLSMNQGISNAQSTTIRAPKPSVEKTIQRILRIPPLQNDVWTISRDGRVSFDTIADSLDPLKAQCKGNGVKFAQCVKGIVDKSGCAKVTPCEGVYCADRC